MSEAELNLQDYKEIEELAERTRVIDRRTALKMGAAAIVAAPVLASTIVPRRALGQVCSAPRKKRKRATRKKATRKRATRKRATRKRATRKKV
ncbi:MAG: hypothetical protein GY937_11310 [bacterium]|nr:hypothetical protein [bacterium]